MVEVELKPLLKRLNRYGTQVLEGAAGLCISRGHYEVTVEHMLLKMCDDPGADLSMILDHFDAELSRVQRSLQRAVEELRSGNAGKPVFSPILVQWIQDGWVLSSIEFSLEQVRSGALVAVATAQSGRFLSSDHPELEKVRADELRHGFKDIVAGSSEEAAMIADSARGAAAHAVPAGGAAPGAPETALGRFATAQEQPDRGRQGRRGQDRGGRGAGAAHRSGRRARPAQGRRDLQSRHGVAASRRGCEGRVREPSEERHPGGQAIADAIDHVH
jgi:type VI secretion system protein VasG